ncbi:MAG: hypothetical protein WDN31_16145 [Hyphomicrobium sp.]
MSLLTSLWVIPFPNIDPVALHIGPIAIKWYGLAYLAGCCSAGSISGAC